MITIFPDSRALMALSATLICHGRFSIASVRRSATWLKRETELLD